LFWPRIWLAASLVLVSFTFQCPFATPPALAATFTVNSMTHAVDAVPGDGICATNLGVCTLRAAVMEADSNPSRDVITNPAGTCQLTIPGAAEDYAETGDSDIRQSVTTAGCGEVDGFVKLRA